MLDVIRIYKEIFQIILYMLTRLKYMVTVIKSCVLIMTKLGMVITRFSTVSLECCVVTHGYYLSHSGIDFSNP
jgi:hypothetical protein